MTDVISEVQQKISESGISALVDWNEDFVILHIIWGDWKHDHLRADMEMSKLGFVCTQTLVTEENGSDSYSADHIYAKRASGKKGVPVTMMFPDAGNLAPGTESLYIFALADKPRSKFTSHLRLAKNKGGILKLQYFENWKSLAKETPVEINDIIDVDTWVKEG